MSLRAYLSPFLLSLLLAAFAAFWIRDHASAVPHATGNSLAEEESDVAQAVSALRDAIAVLRSSPTSAELAAALRPARQKLVDLRDSREIGELLPIYKDLAACGGLIYDEELRISLLTPNADAERIDWQAKAAVLSVRLDSVGSVGGPTDSLVATAPER